MGYYTWFEGSVMDTLDPNIETKIARAIGKLDYFNLSDEELDEVETIDDVIHTYEHKWYDYIKDMCKISEMFPDSLILIHGEGEEAGDLWDTYFLNGKYAHYRAEVYYPPFNPEDLE